jgi:RNA polymerase sigma-70 factor (ECF subfamily)
MYKICLRYSNDSDDAMDMLQEGYLKIFSKIALYTFDGSFEGWLKRIIINNNLDILKLRKDTLFNHNEYEIKNYTDDEDDDVLERINENNITAEKLLELIQELAPVYRVIFNLFYLENLTHKAIAEKLNISVGASKSSLKRAKESLKKLYLTKYGNNDERT